MDSKEKYEECKKCLENQRLENAYNECIINIETINNKQEKTIVQEQCLKLDLLEVCQS